MYEVKETVQLTYMIAADTREAAIQMVKDIVGASRPARFVLSMTCEPKFDSVDRHPSKQRPRLELVHNEQGEE